MLALTAGLGTGRNEVYHIVLWVGTTKVCVFAINVEPLNLSPGHQTIYYLWFLLTSVNMPLGKLRFEATKSIYKRPHNLNKRRGCIYRDFSSQGSNGIQLTLSTLVREKTLQQVCYLISLFGVTFIEMGQTLFTIKFFWGYR